MSEGEPSRSSPVPTSTTPTLPPITPIPSSTARNGSASSLGNIAKAASKPSSAASRKDLDSQGADPPTETSGEPISQEHEERKSRKSVKIVCPDDEQQEKRSKARSQLAKKRDVHPAFAYKTRSISPKTEKTKAIESKSHEKFSKKNEEVLAPDHHHLDESEEDGPFAYRHYYAYQPTANKLLSKKWEEMNRALHLKKLREVRPTIDNSPPKVYPHLEMRLKKLKLEEDRLVNIQRQNQILLDRIAFQMVKFSQVGAGKATEELPITKIAKTMYTDKRRRKENIILIQNQEISQRIESKLPFYNRFEWLADRRRNLGYLRNISEYPKQYCKLINEFDKNERLVKLTKLGTRARTASPSRREHDGIKDQSEVRPKTSHTPVKSALKKQLVEV